MLLKLNGQLLMRDRLLGAHCFVQELVWGPCSSGYRAGCGGEVVVCATVGPGLEAATERAPPAPRTPRKRSTSTMMEAHLGSRVRSGAWLASAQLGVVVSSGHLLQGIGLAAVAVLKWAHQLAARCARQC
jgi:hypothetical protein